LAAWSESVGGVGASLRVCVGGHSIRIANGWTVMQVAYARAARRQRPDGELDVLFRLPAR